MPRNSSGTYSLPAGNPVAPNTLIETSWANPTMSDLGAAVTDSLDRNGRGSMLAQLKLTDGTVAAPAFAFTSETTTGMYRAASNTLAFAVAGVLAMSMNATTIAFNKTVAFTNAVAFPQGTVGAPGVAFSLDLDTGMWSPAADVIAWSTAAAERLRLSAAGLVSTVIQSNPLGAAATPSYSFTGDLNTGMWSPGADLLALSTAGVERMRIDATGAITTTGNVGIGGSPVGRFDVVGAGETIARVRATDASSARFQLQNSVTGTTSQDGLLLQIAGDGLSGYLWNYENGSITFGTNNAERMRIDASGNVGIGAAPTTARLNLYNPNNSPTLQVHAAVVGSADTMIGNFTNGADADLNIFLTQVGAATKYVKFGPSVNVPLIFQTNNAERMRIDASGNVGIGKTPSYKLDVNGSASAHNWVIGGESTTSAGTFGFTNGNGPAIQVFGSGTGPAGSLLFLTGNNAERMRIDNIGRVGIGRTPTAQKLEVQGTAATVNGDFLWSTSAGGDARFGYEAYTPTGCFNLWSASNVGISFGTGLTERMRITGTGVIQDGSGLELGYRQLNRVFYSGGASTLQQSDNGKVHYKADASNITAPLLADGTTITIYNASGSPRAIWPGSGVTLLKAGGAAQAPVTVATNGYARVWYVGATAVIDGHVS